jgi:A/G-specific adenine glycosylase
MTGARRPGGSGTPGPAVGLLRWFGAHRRPLPWRRDRDPYRIWVAEVMLQQTRVAQAVPYFERFVARFPTVRALARAPLSDVLKAWEGAGYYARARHLHAAARIVAGRLHGRLPEEPAALERLPGVGPYIARAVASIAFGRPVVAVEANGLRVAARWTRTTGDLRSPAVRRRLERALAERCPPGRAGEFNEAVMELGETVCLPLAPRCERCPVAADCRAFLELEEPGRLPRRVRRVRRPHVRGALVVLADGRGRWLVQRRPPRGLLGGLWEFPGGKIEPGELPATAARRELEEETGFRAGPLTPLGVVRHAYSHFSVELHVFEAVPAPGARGRLGRDRRWLAAGALRRLPVPKATEKVVRLLEGRGRPSPGSGPRPGRTTASPPPATPPRRPRAPVRRTAA